MALTLTRDDIFEAIYISVCPDTWSGTHERPSDNYLLQMGEYNAAMFHLRDRVLEDIECVDGPSPMAVANSIVAEAEQVKLGFTRQDSDDYFESEVDLLDFKCAIQDMARISGQSELQLVQRIRQHGDNGKLINNKTLGRQLLLLAAFGNDPEYAR